MHLYKYMPFRESFFSELMLRATPLHALNDPFEGLFNREQIKEMKVSISNVHGLTNYEESDEYNEEYDLNETIVHLQQEFNDLGVLSFTEDYTNPLMWTHYAKEHSGIVIELDFNQALFTNSNKTHAGRVCKFAHNTLFGYTEFPQKVRYRRKTPRFNRDDIFVSQNKYEYQYKKFQEAILLTKANDWIYEKEHRKRQSKLIYRLKKMLPVFEYLRQFLS
ncbi:MAG: DUF2971 domain-containing protein [Mariprofundaceae bacterium]|nr:DUF2971 domain-containing protein [Mariprofundaceae bacterium]